MKSQVKKVGKNKYSVHYNNRDLLFSWNTQGRKYQCVSLRPDKLGVNIQNAFKKDVAEAMKILTSELPNPTESTP